MSVLVCSILSLVWYDAIRLNYYIASTSVLGESLYSIYSCLFLYKSSHSFNDGIPPIIHPPCESTETASPSSSMYVSE